MTVSQPLSKAPPEGKKLIWLQCELPECERLNKGFKEATQALGWSLEIFVFSATDPGKGLQQAIAQNPDYIAISGVPVSVMKSQMAAAHEAGIPVISTGVVDQPSPQGFVAQSGGSIARDAEYLGAWMVGDSNGSANILGLTLPEYPILGTETDYLSGPEFASSCPKCHYEQLELTGEDLAGGQVGTKLVAYLQGHPDINYVFSTFSNMLTGVPEVLKSAGLSDQVRIVSGAGSGPTVEQVPDPIAATTVEPNEYNAWVMVDAAARLAADEALPADYQEKINSNPTWVIDSKQSAELLKPYEYDWPGPGNGAYRDKFKELWKVAE
jgi:ribose transport system substrate-binding protein